MGNPGPGREKESVFFFFADKHSGGAIVLHT